MLNRKGLTATEAELKKLAKEAEAVGFKMDQTAQRSEKSTSRMAKSFDLVGRSIKQVGSALLGAFGAVAIVQGIASLIAEKLKLRRAVSGLEKDLVGLGVATREQASEVGAFLTRLKSATGAIESETIPVIKELTRATKDLGEGLALTQTAAVLAASGFGTLDEVAGSLARLVRGDIPSVAEAFGIDAKAGGELRSQIDIANDMLDLFTKKLEETARARREALSIEPAATRVDPRTGAEVGEEMFSARSAEQKRLLEEFEATEKKIQEGFVAFMEGLFGNAAAADKKVLEEKAKRDGETAKRIVEKRAAIEARAAEALIQQKIAMEEDGSLRRLALELELLDDQKEAALRGAGDSAKARVDIEATFALARMQKEQEFIESQEAQHQEYLGGKLEREEMHAEELQRIREADAQRRLDLMEFDLEQLEEGSDERLRLQEDYLMDEMNKETAAAAAREENVALETLFWLKKIRAAREADSKADRALAAADKNFKLQQGVAWAQAAITFGETIFGENKALAIAEALVSTYAAAAMALRQPPGPPYTIPFAALAIAQGMKQVKAIQATKKDHGGGGKSEAFDDPVNDAMAFSMGRKSVNDFVRLTRDGMVEGFRQALESMGGAPAPIAQVAAGGGDLGGGVTQQISIGNVYGGDAGLRELSRVLERASRLDRPRQFR